MSDKQVVVNSEKSAGILIEPSDGRLAGFQVTLQTKSPITEEYTTAIAHFSYSELQELKAAIDKVVAL